MDHYYVNLNAQTNGDHEVHKASCNHLPSAINRLYLGIYASCREAVSAAKLKNSRADGCYYCSPTCHSR